MRIQLRIFTAHLQWLGMQTVDQYSVETEDTTSTNTDRESIVASVRAGFESFMHVNADITGFLSRTEEMEQRQYVDRVLASKDPDSKEFKDLVAAYTGSFAEQSKAKNLEIYANQVKAPLEKAMEDDVISANSYREWINWIRDRNRIAADKKESIGSVLPDYLQKRYDIAHKRSTLLNHASFSALAKSPDPLLKAMHAKLSDSDYFLETLTIEQREALIVEATNTLPVAEKEQKLFAEFMAALNKAKSDGLITEDSIKRWTARFKDPTVNAIMRVHFVTHQFPTYVSAWKKEHKKRDDLKKKPYYKELKENDVRDFKKFDDDNAFKALHFDEKKNLNLLIENAITAKKEGTEKWNSEVTAAVSRAADLGYISKTNVGSLVSRMRKSGRSIEDVRSFIGAWAKVRYRYDQIEDKMYRDKVPQGFHRKTEEQFLAMSFPERMRYVEQAESRLNLEKSQPKNSPIQDVKGKVQHALDTQDWDEAEYYLTKAWAVATTEEDIQELKSMQKYLNEFGTSTPINSADAANEIAWANQEIAEVLALMPEELRPFYEKALKKGAECTRCIATLVYNVKWCQDRNYIPSDASQGKEQAMIETRNRLRPSGEGHGDGIENGYVDGYNSPAIKKDGWGPNNIFTSRSGADAVVETSNAHKNDFSYWYWGNLRVDGVSKGQYHYVSTQLNHRIKRAARVLEKHGRFYSAIGPSPSFN